MLAWLYDLELHPTGIRFFIFRFITVQVLAFEDIENVAECGVGAWNAYNFKNRLASTAFMISTKKGWFARRILVTPRDPRSFVDHLRALGVHVRQFEEP